MTPQESQTLEIGARRKLAEGVIHHENCEKLSLHGWDWAIQSLRRSVTFTPKFGESVCMEIDASESPDPELEALAKRIGEGAPIEEGELCESCGQPKGASLVVDLGKHMAWLALVADYALRNLRRQYELTDEQASELLAFSGDGLPQWVEQCMRHADGLPTKPPAHVPQSDVMTQLQGMMNG